MMYRVPLLSRMKYLAHCYNIFSDSFPMLKTLPPEVWNRHMKLVLAEDYPTAVILRDEEDGKPWSSSIIEFPTEEEVTMFMLKWS